MDNIKIEVFKSEITNCIDKYENNIQQLKVEYPIIHIIN